MTITRKMWRNCAVVLAAVVIVVSACGPAEETGTSPETTPSPAESSQALSTDDAREIGEVLDAQVAAWNRGSIQEFMAGYARTDTLRFASGGNVWLGWQKTFERYQATYADEGQMGTLTFSERDTWRLSDRYALVFGRWELARSESYTNIGGLFTLLFERGEAGWRIVHDHTSARQTLESGTQTE